MKRKFEFEGISFEEYRRRRYEQNIKTVMGILGWKEDEYIIK